MNQKISKILLVMLLLTASYITLGAELPEEKLLENLVKKPVSTIVPMNEFLREKGYKPEFDGEVYFIALNEGPNAVFKTQPDNDMGDAFAEVAAYKASKFLGFPEIPPTVIRKINGKMGSLQLYIEPFEDATKPGIYKNALKNSNREDVANLKLFYFVFGQWDTGAHNIILTKSRGKVKLVAIDNSGIRNHQFVKYGELPFVRICYSDKLNTNDWHLPFPWKNEAIIEHPTIKNLKKVFGDKIPTTVLKNLSKYGVPIHYVIYRNSLWIQYHKEDSGFEISHTNYYPEKSISALKNLNMIVLKKIFSDTKGADFLTQVYLQAILDRRDQVILAYENQKKNIKRNNAQ